MAAITYPIAVRSLADMFPDLSQISALESHRINEGKTAGDPFDMNAAYDAEQTVKELEPLTRVVPELSHEHIEAAKNRAHVLRAIHATTALGASGILARLDKIQNSQAATQAIVDENRAMLQETRAMLMNIRLAAQNAKVPQERDHYKPLQKTRSGHGRELALQVARPESIAHLPPTATIQVAAIGTINSLIIFYNDDFDIEREDNLEVRKIKFRRWLCS